MNNRLFLSVAAAALIAGSGMAHAQAGMSREAPSGGAAAQNAPARSAPSADRAAPAERAAPVTRDEATDTSKRPEPGAAVKSTQSDDKVQRDNGDQRATDSTRDNTKARTGANDTKSADPKAAANPADANRTNADAKGADGKSNATTGQAAAGAKLSTEQRTKITTVIRQQKVERVTNVNFSISVGTRVPRDVRFHPLPAEIITVYPDWRGYDFILVGDQIIVINPGSYEIVAVLDA
jgi:hypothetical protein